MLLQCLLFFVSVEMGAPELEEPELLTHVNLSRVECRSAPRQLPPPSLHEIEKFLFPVET